MRVRVVVVVVMPVVMRMVRVLVAVPDKQVRMVVPAAALKPAHQQSGSGHREQRTARRREPWQQPVGSECLCDPEHRAEEQHADRVGGRHRGADGQHLAARAPAADDRRGHQRLSVARRQAVQGPEQEGDAERQRAGGHTKLAPADDAREHLCQPVGPAGLRVSRRLRCGRGRPPPAGECGPARRCLRGRGQHPWRHAAVGGVGRQERAGRGGGYVGALEGHAVAVQHHLAPADPVGEVPVGQLHRGRAAQPVHGLEPAGEAQGGQPGLPWWERERRGRHSHVEALAADRQGEAVAQRGALAGAVGVALDG